MSISPLVSCIMPTANRPEFIINSIDLFLAQDYPHKELIIIDDGIESCVKHIPARENIHYFYYQDRVGTIGTKRNSACEKAHGDYILHWDDDDWYAPDWITQQVNLLVNTKADITGLHTVKFYSPSAKRGLVYENTGPNNFWLCGATLAYKKSLWEMYHFADLQIGEDADFLTNSGGKIVSLDYSDGFTAGLHLHNISIKHLDDYNQLEFTNLNLNKSK